ncbi:MAG UNVERIFIED_CONTAM: hypothetical protein LVQ98_09125 [Rickettsiaceae bacterium]
MHKEKNLFDFHFLKGLYDIIKFNKHAAKIVKESPDITLDRLMIILGMSDWFQNNYLVSYGFIDLEHRYT